MLPDAGVVQSQLRQGPVQQPEQLHPVSVAGDKFRVNIPETVYRAEGMSSASEVKMFKIDVSKAGAKSVFSLCFYCAALMCHV
jgi:hypothetical protein